MKHDVNLHNIYIANTSRSRLRWLFILNCKWINCNTRSILQLLRKSKETYSIYSGIIKIAQFIINEETYYIDFKYYSLELIYINCERRLSKCNKWHEHTNSLFERFNAIVSQLVDFLLSRSFNSLIHFATAITYTSLMVATSKQRDSRLSLSPSPPYPPVLERNNHKIRK